MIFTDSTRPTAAAGPLGSPLTRLNCWSPEGCTSDAPWTLLMPFTEPPPFPPAAWVTPTGAVSTLPSSSFQEPKNWYDEFTAQANAATIVTCVTATAPSRPSTCHSPGLANRGHSQTSSATHRAASAASAYTV